MDFRRKASRGLHSWSNIWTYEWGKSNTEPEVGYQIGYQSEKAMAPHSSTLVWKIPWMEEPGRLQSMGSPRVRHD